MIERLLGGRDLGSLDTALLRAFILGLADGSESAFLGDELIRTSLSSGEEGGACVGLVRWRVGRGITAYGGAFSWLAQSVPGKVGSECEADIGTSTIG